MSWRMIYDGVMTQEDTAIFEAVDDWFKENLQEPPACKGGDQAVITYFKVATTGHMLEKLEPAMKLLNKYNHPYDVVYTNFVNEIVYEDEYQVAVRVEL